MPDTSYRQALVGQPDAVVADGDEVALVEVADGTLVGFLRNFEAVVDELCGTLVAEVAAPVVLVEIAQQRLCEVECVLLSGGLQSEVDLVVLTDVVDLGCETIASA